MHFGRIIDDKRGTFLIFLESAPQNYRHGPLCLLRHAFYAPGNGRGRTGCRGPISPFPASTPTPPFCRWPVCRSGWRGVADRPHSTAIASHSRGRAPGRAVGLIHPFAALEAAGGALGRLLKAAGGALVRLLEADGGHHSLEKNRPLGIGYYSTSVLRISKCCHANNSSVTS